MLETVVLCCHLILPGKAYITTPQKPPQKPVTMVHTSPLLNRREKDLDDFIEFIKNLVKPKLKSKQKRHW
jgi:hypothetical protein